MTLLQTAFAIALLLLTPGPTNTLLALSGAERGWRGALRLIPCEVAGYLAATLPVVLAGAPLLAAAPGMRTAVTLAAAAWVLWLAVAMWRLPQGGPEAQDASVDGRRVLVTTLLNPKVLVFGLVLLPADQAGRLALNIALFTGLVIVVAAAWAALGAMLARGGRDGQGTMPPVLRRAASVWLGLLAAWLASGAAAAFG